MIEMSIQIVHSTNKDSTFSKSTCMLIAFLPFLAIVLLSRNIRVMSIISFVGNVFMISSIVLIFGVCSPATQMKLDLATCYSWTYLEDPSLDYRFQRSRSGCWFCDLFVWGTSNGPSVGKSDEARFGNGRMDWCAHNRNDNSQYSNLLDN